MVYIIRSNIGNIFIEVEIRTHLSQDEMSMRNRKPGRRSSVENNKRHGCRLLDLRSTSVLLKD